MTYLTRNPVRFGSVVRHTSGVHYLVVGWLDMNKEGAVCERPDSQPRIFHRDSLTVVKQPRTWASRARS